jgi:multidrug efflux pump subunit AcrB
MWIIRLALKRPYTFVVAALLLLLVTPFVLLRTPTDVLPEINIPVVSIIWNFTGLSAKDIEQRMVYTEERVLTTTVNDIQHIESTSYDGIGIIKVFFQPTVTISTAVARLLSFSTAHPTSPFFSMVSAATAFPNNKQPTLRSTSCVSD